jgi:hypothetical protein
LRDVGRYREANRHFLQGLVLARDAADRELTASLLWQLGKIDLEREHPTDALSFFQFARLAAQDAGSHAELARIHAGEAWAYALVGQPKLVEDALARSGHEGGQVVAGQEPPRFHGAAHFWSTYSDCAPSYVATAHWMLARGTDRSAARSAELAAVVTTRILAGDKPRLPGVRLALRQTTLAGALLCARERDTGLAAAHEAVDQVAAIRSAQATGRLRYLAEAAKAWPRNQAAVELRHRIAKLPAA